MLIKFDILMNMKPKLFSVVETSHVQKDWIIKEKSTIRSGSQNISAYNQRGHSMQEVVQQKSQTLECASRPRNLRNR